MAKTLIFFIILTTIFTGCSQLSEASHVADGKTYPATNASDVTILFEKPERPHAAIGLVESHGVCWFKNKCQQRAMQALQEEAAAMGAHAVIITSSQMKAAKGMDDDPAGSENVISGHAIRYIE